MATVTICSDFGAPQNKVCHCSHCFPIYLPWSDGTRCYNLSFLNIDFSLSSFTFIKISLVLLCFLPLVWCHLHIWGFWYFSQQPWFHLLIHPVWHFAWYTLCISYISRVTIYSVDIFLSWFGTSLLLHVQL